MATFQIKKLIYHELDFNQRVIKWELPGDQRSRLTAVHSPIVVVGGLPCLGGEGGVGNSW